ncbi:hypothetical protein CBM2587_A30043 [Cupriavidus taiwanensis]|uniref:Uncharacterized protein n=1 Tax=Cupriavidus taiwanensis TaxID=164546 RepID=A0A975X1T2_9BURK|nr:hypothetical protein CBM2587_A30043 [Cupriavidus taiwanensis]
MSEARVGMGARGGAKGKALDDAANETGSKRQEHPGLPRIIPDQTGAPVASGRGRVAPQPAPAGPGGLQASRCPCRD